MAKRGNVDRTLRTAKEGSPSKTLQAEDVAFSQVLGPPGSILSLRREHGSKSVHLKGTGPALREGLYNLTTAFWL